MCGRVACSAAMCCWGGAGWLSGADRGGQDREASSQWSAPRIKIAHIHPFPSHVLMSCPFPLVSAPRLVCEGSIGTRVCLCVCVCGGCG